MPEADPLVGTTLGPCRLVKLVGRGGMGRVYKGRHLALDRAVAVKLVDRALGGSDARAAVLSEARAAAKLEDPRAVAVYEVGEDKGVAYLVMQWVDGESLQERVERAGPLEPKEALAAVRDIAGALAAAHAAGLVHRDVKPGNVLLAAGGAKLTDFGLAGPVGAAPETSAGSFHFMAPEQGYGAPPDPRADLYSLGATWYYALTGEPPFPGSAADALLRHRDEAAPNPRAKRPEVTDRAAELILRLMSKDPAARPADGRALLQELASKDLLLDVDVSGSPFRLKPAYARPEPPPAPAASPAPAAFTPPPPPPAAPLGSRTTFYVLFGVLAAAAALWPWRGAVVQDWVAAAAFLSVLPVLLSLRARRSPWGRAAGAAAVLGGLVCFAVYVRGAGGSPPLETVI
ncbi:MAG: serine/threonine protein kinase, partial [Elusimicrobia bacterium]|nr:serine/threonine protein kinase [Elusimicrobiota bacterium]